jgi:hypothetical protein
LRLIIDSIAVFWAGIPKVERKSRTELADRVDSIVSFRRKLDGVPEEQKSALMRVAREIVKDVVGLDPDEIIDESKVVRHGTPLDDGFYWMFKGGGYIPCEDHYGFVLDNQPMFIDRLGIDAWKFMNSRHSGGGELMRLVLSSGAVAIQIYGSGKKRCAKYQCCRSELPWVKKKILKMPMISSIVRIYDPAKLYEGFDCGIKFILHK